MKPKNRNRIVLTSFVAATFSMLAVASVISIVTSAEALAGAKSIETVELRLNQFSGADGYVEYVAVDAQNSIGANKVSLRCTDHAYDGAVAWSYNELMVLDPQGPVINRKEPRADVKQEHGFSYVFASFAECEKASPTVLDESAECRIRVAIDKTPIKRKSEKQAKGTAKLISAECVPKPKAK